MGPEAKLNNYASGKVEANSVAGEPSGNGAADCLVCSSSLQSLVVSCHYFSSYISLYGQISLLSISMPDQPSHLFWPQLLFAWFKQSTLMH